MLYFTPEHILICFSVLLDPVVTMLNLKLILSLLATALVAVHGQDSIDQNDIPNECQSQCQNVLNQSQNCDNQYDNDNNNNNNNNSE